MNSLISFLETDFNTQRDQWEKTLLSELKLPEIGNKSFKKLTGGMSWPTLSLDRKHETQLSSTDWKKSSNTYAHGVKEEMLLEDLEAGVRNFFFFDLTEKDWALIEKTFQGFSHKEDLEVFILGEKKYNSSSFKVISDIVSGREAHDQGAHTLQELGFMARNLIEKAGTLKEAHIGVYVDSLFFQNIAKLRAARLIATKILVESGLNIPLKIVALTSYQGWTLFERYSNMLRNEAAVASSYIGGADHIQSSGYNTIFDLETESPVSDHQERSLRMARNTSHILALESMLGVVQDAAYGSYHLENLTDMFCEESWKIMQRLLSGENLSEEIKSFQEERLKLLKTRKTILSGINDFPDFKENLPGKLKAPFVARPARAFEELRIRMQNSKKPEVYIALFGDYGQLNARLNFVKNYFELLGLTVHETGHSVTDPEAFRKDLASRKEDILVICSTDEGYPEVTQDLELSTDHKFIAGKFELPGFKNLFVGQNIYEVLESIVNSFEGRKS